MSETTKSMTKSNSTSLSNMKKDDIVNMLSTQTDSLAPLIPNHSELTPEYIITSTALVVLGNDKLQTCSKKSLIGAMLKMAETGLRYSYDECYLIPYKSEIDFRISYKGMRKLAERSIQVKRVIPRCVYEGDVFEYNYGLKPDLKHTPLTNGSRDWKQLTHTYAIAYLIDGSSEFVVLSKEEIEKRRMANPFQSTQPSKNWLLGYDKMAMSKAIRDLVDNLPLEQEIKNQIQDNDNLDYKGRSLNARPDNVDEDGVIEEAEIVDPTDEAEDYLKELEQEDESSK